MNLRYVAVSMLNFFTTLVLGLLGLRFILRLFGANETAAFVAWVYEASDVLLQPFRGIFPTQTFENQYVLEVSTIFAMIAYVVLALVVSWLINIVAPEPAVTKTTRTKRRK